VCRIECIAYENSVRKEKRRARADGTCDCTLVRLWIPDAPHLALINNPQGASSMTRRKLKAAKDVPLESDQDYDWRTISRSDRFNSNEIEL
jgi:hypothetical protein